MRRGRLALAFVLLLGVVTTGPHATAQSPGSELAEAVAADAAGEQAYITLASVDAFPADGGEAVFEPGTDHEEVFTYTAAEPDSDRLVGLTRPAATAHAEGVFVQAPTQDTLDPEPSPSPDETEGDSSEPSADEQYSEASPEAAPAEPPELCKPVLDPSCGEAIEDAVGSIAAATDVCSSMSGCDQPQDVIEGEAPDACVVAMGSTCDEVVGALLDDILGEICDPADNGQTCADVLESFQSPNCVGEACEILEDPLGPWSLCDVNNTGAECPDPDDAIDHAWSIDNPLSSLNCTASVTGPDITEGGGMVRGRGTFDCGESTDSIYLTVCLHRRSGGVWVKMGCRKDFDVLFGSNSLSKKIVERCLKQQTVEYRIRARGQASDGPDEDRDAATQSAKLYCPGPSSVADASIDALEYAESWLPSHE